MAQVLCPHCGSTHALEAVFCADCRGTLSEATSDPLPEAPPTLAAAHGAAREGRNADALRLYAQAAEWAASRETGDATSSLIEALGGQAEIHYRLGAYDDVHRTCSRMLEASAVGLHRAKAKRWIALACGRQGRREEMGEVLAETIAEARGAGVPGRELLAQALCDEANRLCRAGDMDGAMDRLHEMRRIVGTCQGANRLLAAADAAEGSIARRRGEFHRAVVLYASAQATAEEIGDTVQWVVATLGLGQLQGTIRDLVRARRTLEHAQRKSREIGDAELMVGTALALGNVAWAQGDTATARKCNEEALTSWERVGNVSGMAIGRANLAKLGLQEGEWSAAAENARASLELLRGGINENMRARVCADLGAAQVELSETAEARATFEAIIDEFSEAAHPRAVAKARRGLGRIAAGAGDFHRACELLHAAVEILTRVKDEEGAARCRMELVRALWAAGLSREAHFELAQVKAQFDLLDSPKGREAAAELERSLSGSPDRS